MKSLLLGLIMASNIGHASEKANWVCENGDYFASLQATPGAETIQIQVCEFHQCFDEHATKAKLTSAVDGQNFSYLLNGAEPRKVLRLSYKTNGDLLEVTDLYDGQSAQVFNNCYRAD